MSDMGLVSSDLPITRPPDHPMQDTTIAVLDPQAVAEQQPRGIERPMLAENKLPVVLAVVLIIWAVMLLLLFRTERRLARLEAGMKG
jgi:hypothetical protein